MWGKSSQKVICTHHWRVLPTGSRSHGRSYHVDYIDREKPNVPNETTCADLSGRSIPLPERDLPDCTRSKLENSRLDHLVSRSRITVAVGMTSQRVL
jgi:hypothetical protein